MNRRSTLSHVVTVAIVGLLAASQLRAAELPVPGSYATIGAAIAAANPGDTVRIDNSTTYTESLTIDKAITIAAAPGQQPILIGDGSSNFVVKSVNGAGGAQIGTASGGTIIIGLHASNVPARALEANHADATAVVFENIATQQLTYSSTGPNIIEITGPGVSEFRQIQGGGGQRGVAILSSTADGAQILLDHAIFKGNYYSEGFRTSGANVTVIARKCEFYSNRLQAAVFQVGAQGSYTFENCWIWHDNNFDLLEIRPDTTAVSVTLSRCLLDQRSVSRTINGSVVRFRTNVSSGSSAFIDHCDLYNRSTISSRSGVSIDGGTDRTVTVTNSNIIGPHSTVTGIADNATSTTIVVGWNNILTGGAQYVNITPPATDVNPPLDPQYSNLDAGDAHYAEVALKSADSVGGAIGSTWDHGQMVPVELSTFSVN